MMKNLKVEIKRLKSSKSEQSRKKLINLLQSYLFKHGKDAKAWNDLAHCYENLGMKFEAEPCYQKVYEIWKEMQKKTYPDFSTDQPEN